MTSLAVSLAPKSGTNVSVVRPTSLNAVVHKPIACWFATKVQGEFGGTAYTAAVATLNDQAGGAKNLVKTGTAATITQDTAGTDVLAMAATPTSYSRADALGLAPDPALTIAWRMKVTGDLAAGYPTVMSLGTSGTAELNVYCWNAVNDVLEVSNWEVTASVQWILPAGTLAGEHAYTITKPAGVGYSDDWRLYIDQNPFSSEALGQGPAPGQVDPGAMALGSSLTLLGDYDGGGFPFVGTLAGLTIWDRVLTGNDLAALNEFLFYR